MLAHSVFADGCEVLWVQRAKLAGTLMVLQSASTVSSNNAIHDSWHWLPAP